jgi:outer membrane biogenesis lipoprotein LolB
MREYAQVIETFGIRIVAAVCLVLAACTAAMAQAPVSSTEPVALEQLKLLLESLEKHGKR